MKCENITAFETHCVFQSLKNSHQDMEEVGFLQVKVIKANDLPAADLNSNPSAQSTARHRQGPFFTLSTN